MLRQDHVGRSVQAAIGDQVSRWDGLVAVIALAIIIVLFVAAPGSLLDKADRAAYAVCHRIAERTYLIAGRPLPFCARCSGTYLGALVALVAFAVRGRLSAARLPGRKYLAVLGGFMLLWLLDGVNSYLTLFPGLPNLYQPHNVLRLATGTLEGLAIASMLLPVVNFCLWRTPSRLTTMANWQDVAWLLVGGALVIAAVNSEFEALLYPLALLSALMALVLLGALNGMAVLLVLRRDGRAASWPAVVAPLLVGGALALLEMAAIGLVRDYLTVRFGLPF